MFPHWERKLPVKTSGKPAYRPFQGGGNVLKPITGALLFFYQQILSEQIQADCVYETTCSSYMKQCLETYGTGRGILSGLYRYTTCTGFEIRYRKEIEIDRHGKIINQARHEIW